MASTTKRPSWSQFDWIYVVDNLPVLCICPKSYFWFFCCAKVGRQPLWSTVRGIECACWISCLCQDLEICKWLEIILGSWLFECPNKVYGVQQPFENWGLLHVHLSPRRCWSERGQIFTTVCVLTQRSWSWWTLAIIKMLVALKSKLNPGDIWTNTWKSLIQTLSNPLLRRGLGFPSHGLLRRVPSQKHRACYITSMRTGWVWDHFIGIYHNVRLPSHPHTTSLWSLCKPGPNPRTKSLTVSGRSSSIMEWHYVGPVLPSCRLGVVANMRQTYSEISWGRWSRMTQNRPPWFLMCFQLPKPPQRNRSKVTFILEVKQVGNLWIRLNLLGLVAV